MFVCACVRVCVCVCVCVYLDAHRVYVSALRGVESYSNDARRIRIHNLKGWWWVSGAKATCGPSLHPWVSDAELPIFRCNRRLLHIVFKDNGHPFAFWHDYTFIQCSQVFLTVTKSPKTHLLHHLPYEDPCSPQKTYFNPFKAYKQIFFACCEL